MPGPLESTREQDAYEADWGVVTGQEACTVQAPQGTGFAVVASSWCTVLSPQVIASQYRMTQAATEALTLQNGRVINMPFASVEVKRGYRIVTAAGGTYLVKTVYPDLTGAAGLSLTAEKLG